MRTGFDHSQKYETESEVSGRSRRDRDTPGIHTPSGPIAGCSTPAVIGLALGQVVKPKFIDKQSAPSAKIGEELAMYLQEHPTHDSTVRKSLSMLSERLDSAELEAFLENDPEGGDAERVVIEVSADLEDIEAYKDLKSRVRRIVRALEGPDTMVYTRINKLE